MPRLSKTVLANTFKLDCDRYLRFRLASPEERERLRLKEHEVNRPGPQLMIETGEWWEAGRYDDMVALAPPDAVAYALSADPNDPHKYAKVEGVFDLLRLPEPPVAILEGEYAVPEDFLPGVAELLKRHGIDRAHCRPDILWIRKAPTGVPCLSEEASVTHEIHVVDIKMAAEPSLKHFTEVTYYALALAKALQIEGLSDRYAVCAQGYIWPGTYDIHRFRNLVAEYRATGEPDPLTAALLETLVAVPHEVYEAHVRHFFLDRLPAVLDAPPEEAGWHITQKCQLCDYLGLCKEQAHETDHLCRIPWLNHGQADLLRQPGIELFTTRDLVSAIENDTNAWRAASRLSQPLRADAPAILARARAMESGLPHAVEGRVCHAMPRWTHMSIYLTVHFDPGSGITFAMGASRVYWPKDRQRGEKPVTDEKVFRVDRAENLNPETERKRLIELIQTVYDWLMEAETINRTIAKDRDRVTAQIYLWDPLEMRQLRRMLERHMEDASVVEAVELLVRLFPPDNVLPDWETHKSQPYTIVKDAFRQVAGLPLAHDYTLFDTVDTFYPDQKDDGSPWRARRPYGFHTPMSDQIPFERGYELWLDKVNLRHRDMSDPEHPRPGRLYTRDEVYAGMEEAVLLRLRDLQKVVERLQKYHRDQLGLWKSGFRARKPSKANIPAPARKVLAFEKLNSIVAELENRQMRALPVEEREARFVSIRGLRLASGAVYEDAIDRVRADRSEETADRPVYAFTFSPESRDAKVKEGDFLLALSNEEPAVDLDAPWYRIAGLTFDSARERLAVNALGDGALVRARMRDLTGVTVHLLATTADPPFLVLSPNKPEFFRFATMALDGQPALLDMGRPMVLDPLHQDFQTKAMEETLRAIGGKAGAFEAAKPNGGKP